MSLMQKFFLSQDKKIGFKLIFALILGICLLFLSNGDKKKNILEQKKNLDLEENEIDFDCDSYIKKLEIKLENLLSQIKGAGNIKVMLSVINSKEIILAQDINLNESNTKENDKSGITREISEKKQESKKIIIDNKPLIIKEIMPEITGAIILAEGGDNILIKSEIIKAVKVVLNLEAHKIQVLKMK